MKRRTVILEAKMTPQEVAQRLDDIANGNREVDMGDLEDTLDAALVHNRENKDTFGSAAQVVNILVIGEPGGGKTGIIQAWARSRGVKLVKLTGADVDPDMTKGVVVRGKTKDGKGNEVDRALRLAPQDFDALDTPDGQDAVLFFDELNRSWVEAEGALLTLIQDHEIRYGNEMHHFDNLLFTIAAINPPTGKQDPHNPELRNLGQAMKTRFQNFYWTTAVEKTSEYWYGTIDDAEAKINQDFNDGKIQQGVYDRRLNHVGKLRQIIEALANSPDFEYSSQERIEIASEGHTSYINARTLWTAILSCNGEFGELDPDVILDPEASTKFRPTQAHPGNCFLATFIANCEPDAAELQAAVDAWEDYIEANPALQNSMNTAVSSIYSTYVRWKKKYDRQNQNK